MEKQIKILVVDDDNNLRETLVDLLEIEGYKVYQAGSAAECLEICATEFFNVILMDFNILFMVTSLLINFRGEHKALVLLGCVWSQSDALCTISGYPASG